MTLRNPVDIPFSELKENREEKPIRLTDYGEKEPGSLICFGCLPNGESYGVVKAGVGFDPGYYEYCAALVRPDGEARCMTLLHEHYSLRLPDAMAAAASDDHIVWKIGGDLYSWKPGYPDYEGAFHINERIPEKAAITDAVLRENGILEINFADGKTWHLVLGAKALLEPAESGWTAHCNKTSCYGSNYVLQKHMDEEAHINGLILEEGVGFVEDFVFSGCGLHRIRLPRSLYRIGFEAFSENPSLDRITIPAGVTDVGSFAFHGCQGLRELTIEGDLSRIKGWAEDAFEGCPCEEYYLHLRKSA